MWLDGAKVYRSVAQESAGCTVIGSDVGAGLGGMLADSSFHNDHYQNDHTFLVDIGAQLAYTVPAVMTANERTAFVEQDLTKPVTGFQPGPATFRRRQHMALTCHQDTLDRLDVLCGRWSTTRGRVVDRLVEILSRAYESGVLHCIHGQPCQLNRKDLPGIF
jgi:hypothetical protein